MDHLVAVDELGLGQRQDAIAIERRLEGEVEAGERLDRGEPGPRQRRDDDPSPRSALVRPEPSSTRRAARPCRTPLSRRLRPEAGRAAHRR